MDLLENLGKQLSQVTVYDIKSYYNQAKNMVMNYTEMESKVREATNDEPWGASTTLMNDIAQGTHNYQYFNEIMPTICASPSCSLLDCIEPDDGADKRFTEKEASEWRQIYKALQLLEYLIKNGSERVVDDARSHISMIKILRSFHYVDEKGKDQGINVRNRSKELAELLSDLDKIRQERRKARQNKGKYGGIESGGGGSFGGGFGSSSSSSRYGGFGSDSPSYEIEGSSSGYSGFKDSSRKQQFDEYDAGDDEDKDEVTLPSHSASTSKSSKPVPEAPKQPVKEVNLLDGWDDPEPAPVVSAAPAPIHQSALGSLDDDFDDFQTATPAASKPAPVQNIMSSFSASPAPPAAAKPSFFDMMGSQTTSQPPVQLSAYTSPVQPPVASPPLIPASSGTQGFSSFQSPPTPAQPSKPSSDAFGDLFASLGSSTASSTSSKPKQTIADLAKQKADQQIWSSPAPAASSSGNGLDDLLF